ncbi:MAG TPA: sigma-E factor regulatory protein RseB domain-containing protein [Planctomycetaceae bacterium]|nr:sigma-E factor regulatory protein RseB domain-containing protein [Planctomycetaceae bacterium]
MKKLACLLVALVIVETAAPAAFAQTLPSATPATFTQPQPTTTEQNQAEKLFRESEKKLADADQAQITVESTLEGAPGQGSAKGTLLLAKGNKASVVVQGHLRGDEFKASFVSNGTKMKMAVTKLAAQQEQKTPHDLNAMIVGSFSRLGILAGFRNTTQQPGEEEPGLEDMFKVSDFTMGKKERVAGRDAQVIDYKLVINNSDTAENTIWIDTETKLLLKRVINSKNGNESIRITETYQICVDGNIDGKSFELPK